jgi:hypothetical protein
MTKQATYPLHRLIEQRRETLGLTRTEVLRRMGYKSISKGIRRLEAIKAGDLRDAEFFHAPLAQALEVEPQVVEDAFQATREQVAAEGDAAYRAAFRPHLVWITHYRIPHPIHVAALCGGVEKKHAFFQPGSDPATFLAQAQAMLVDPPLVPGFGAIEGFVINYSPDTAVRFDLQGRELERLPRAERVGRARLRM